MVVLRLFFSYILSVLFTLYLIPVFIKIAYKFNVLDVPDGAIKTHKQPTPYLGGVAVYLGFIMTLALVFPFYNTFLYLVLGVTLLLFIGLIDDLIRMKAYQKFFGQLIATFCFLRSGFYLKESFFMHNYWNIPLSMLWILTIINAFNLVDVMDGLATILALSATFAFFFIALALGQMQLAILLAAFFGSLCAFFWFNRPPAQIYLGDAGSLFIGGFLATVPFLLPWGTFNWYGFVAPMVILALPLWEIVSLVLIRTYKRIPFYYGSPDHFCMYLLKKRWKKQQILQFCTVITTFLFASAVALVVGNVNSYFSIASAFLALFLFSITVWY